jgi:tRNA dimethylallyltransferase
LGKVPDNKKLKNNTKYSFLQIGIAREKEELHQRIKFNVKKRFDLGMIEEVENLKKQGLSWNKIMSFGLSYKSIPQYLNGEIKTQEELIEKIYLAEKNYAKRQMTWFKKDKRIKWLNNYEDIEIDVEKFLYTR